MSVRQSGVGKLFTKEHITTSARLISVFCYNNNNSDIALYPKNLQARGAVHYQHQNPLDNQKRTSTINAYINIKMTKKQG